MHTMNASCQSHECIVWMIMHCEWERIAWECIMWPRIASCDEFSHESHRVIQTMQSSFSFTMHTMNASWQSHECIVWMRMEFERERIAWGCTSCDQGSRRVMHSHTNHIVPFLRCIPTRCILIHKTNPRMSHVTRHVTRVNESRHTSRHTIECVMSHVTSPVWVG